MSKAHLLAGPVPDCQALVYVCICQPWLDRVKDQHLDLRSETAPLLGKISEVLTEHSVSFTKRRPRNAPDWSRLASGEPKTDLGSGLLEGLELHL